MAHDFDVACIEVVGIERTECEVPHDFGRRLWIVGIYQRERQAGLVVAQLAVGLEGDLGRVMLGADLYGGGDSR